MVDSDYQIEPGLPAPLRPAVRRPVDRLRPGAAGLPRLAGQRRTTGGCTTPTSTSSPSRSPSRNEHDGAIFAGTMGLIRRVALEQLGGWDEWCITEDAELSLRLLRAGWHGLHVDQSWGYGIMPLTFEALKGQRYRWCFGGIQILRMHWRSLMPGRGEPGEPPEHRPALGLPGRRHPVVRRPARPGLLRLPAGRRGQPGHRRGRAVPQAHHLPGRRGAGDGGARAGPRGGAAAPRDGGVVAGRDRRVLHLAVHLAGGGAGVGARRCSPARRRSCARRRPASGPSGGRRCGRTGPSRSLAVLGLAGIAGALTRWYQLSGPLLAALLLFPTLGFAAAPFNSWAAQRATLPGVAARAAAHRVPPGPAGLRGGRRHRRRGRGGGRGRGRGRAAALAEPQSGAVAQPGGPRPGHELGTGSPEAVAQRSHPPRRPPPPRPPRRRCRPARRSRPHPAPRPRPLPPRRSRRRWCRPSRPPADGTGHALVLTRRG